MYSFYNRLKNNIIKLGPTLSAIRSKSPPTLTERDKLAVAALKEIDQDIIAYGQLSIKPEGQPGGGFLITLNYDLHPMLIIRKNDFSKEITLIYIRQSRCETGEDPWYRDLILLAEAHAKI